MMHRVGDVAEFAPGSIQIREIGKLSIGIVNTGAEIHAVLNVCPHALAPICEGRLTGTMVPSRPGEAVWGLQDRILRCPWHGYEFDLGDEGRAVFTSFKGKVRMYPVSVEGGVVYVKTRSGGA